MGRLVSRPLLTRVPARPLAACSRLRQISTKMTSAKLDQVEDVDIDTGRFKYILIKVHDSPEGGPEVTKHIVRGYSSAGFHADVYDKVVPGIEAKGLDCEC